MKNLFSLLALCFIITGCVKGGTDVEYEDNTTIVGHWKQTIHNVNTYYLDADKKVLKYYYYDESGKEIHIVNGNYTIKGDSIYAKELLTNKYRNYYYFMPHCNGLFFGDSKIGFIRVK